LTHRWGVPLLVQGWSKGGTPFWCAIWPNRAPTPVCRPNPRRRPVSCFVPSRVPSAYRPARTRSGFARLSPIATGARSHVHILGLSRHKTPAKRVAFSCGFVLVNFYRVPRVHEYKT
jgi:hypothetical protein